MLPILFSKLIIPQLYRLTEKNYHRDGVQCHFKDRKDAKGVDEDDIGTADTAYLCFRNVQAYAKKNSQQSINGATWHTSDKKCYAEIGAKSLEDKLGWESCIFSGIAEKHCAV